MLCYRLNLPVPFGWTIKGVGKCTDLVRELSRIMQLPEASGENADLTVMPRSHYNSLSELELSGLEIFYSRKGVRLFYDRSSEKWFLVFPEDILDDRNTCIVLMWLLLRPYYLHCIKNGALPVHAASAELDGGAILIAAAGDTGKTTTVRRLPPPWRELADDAAMILPNGEDFFLYPWPTWSEFIYGRNPHFSWNIQKGRKLTGIFFLEQSEDDSAEKLAQVRGLMSLQKSVMEAIAGFEKDLSVDINKKLFDTVSRVSRKIPAFTLRASRDGEVWKSIETAIENKY